MEQKAIKPHHLFHHRGGWYVIDVEGMSAGAVDDRAAEALAAIAAGSAAPLAPPLEEQLEKLGLLSASGGQTPKAKRETKKDPVPVVNMALFLTQSCNLRCVYCYGDGGGYGSGGDMAETTALQAVDWLLAQAGKIKKLYIGFFGGEPFLNFPLMQAVVEYAEKKVREAGKEVQFHATTNATLLDDETIDFIKEHRIEIQISFDGPQDVQDAQRPCADGRGSYAAAVPRIKKLLAAVPETHGHAVIVGDTDPELVKAALREIGFVDVSVTPASKSLFAGPDRAQAARDTQNHLQALEQESQTWVNLTRARDGEALQSLKAKSGLYPALTALLHNSKKRHACGAGLGLVGVSAAGDVYLCHRFVGQEEYKLGSVFAQGLDRDEYQKSPAAESGVCAACFAKYYCAGGCKHDNAGACGSATAPSEDLCRLRRRELELAAAITCRLDPGDKAFLVEHEIFPPKPCPFDF